MNIIFLNGIYKIFRHDKFNSTVNFIMTFRTERLTKPLNEFLKAIQLFSNSFFTRVIYIASYFLTTWRRMYIQWESRLWIIHVEVSHLIEFSLSILNVYVIQITLGTWNNTLFIDMGEACNIFYGNILLGMFVKKVVTFYTLDCI